jgi:hypothetical protein
MQGRGIGMKAYAVRLMSQLLQGWSTSAVAGLKKKSAKLEVA